MANNDLPPGWQQRSISDFLSHAELMYLERVWKANNGDMMAFMDALKPWFHEPERAARLEANGMLPSYAAYAIPFFFAKAKEAEAGQGVDDIVDGIMGQGSDPSKN